MTVLAPRSAEWHADRAMTLGASDAPILTGDSPWGDVLQLYAVKAGIIDPPAIENNATRWGLRLEAVVAEWYTETYGVRLRRDNTRPRHPKYPWMATSLDRRVIGENALVEIKTSRYASDEWGQPDTAQVPAHIFIQAQHEMAVTGAETCYIAVLFAGSDPRRYIISRDDELIADLIALEAEFMDCVRTGTPPEAIIRKQRPPAYYRHDEIDADETLARGIEGLYLLRQEIKGLKADEEKASEAVKTILGDHTAVRAGDYRATYKQNADSHPVRWELVAAAYRKAIAAYQDGGPLMDLDLDATEALFTEDKPGLRLLRITKREEPS